ncbi:MAG: tetratricopeptide repeat protein [Bacteroidota bacterium]
MKQLSYSIIIALFLWLPIRISACYNEYYTLDKQGNSHHINQGEFRFHTNFDLSSVEDQLKALEKKLQMKPSLQLMSDYALNLVRAGKVKEALVLFEKLVAKYPNEYALQANLGTTYELTGENELALKHIKRGLELNPNSHQGSEWVHVKIPEAKIAMENNPKYLNNHTVLSLTSGKEQSEKTGKQLMIQLKERFPFCKGPDAVMADLFHDLGDCYSETKSYEYAKAFYQIALEYYGSKDAKVNQKIEEARILRTKYEDTPIVPEEKYTGVQYVNEKVKGVPYKELLSTYPAHTINWKGITTDTNVLLAYLGLDEPEPKEGPVLQTPKKNSQEDGSAKKTPPAKDNTIFYGFIFLTISMVILAVALFNRKRRK